jgi:3-dehydroquinate dehydratase-2
MNILVLNGPNLNLLGQREPALYGTLSMGEIESMLRRGAQRHVRLDFHQSNHEGALIDQLHQAPRKYQGVVFNPGAYAHTSIALRDAIAAIPIPVIEIHISNIHGREEFRSRSLTAGVCAGIVSGLGPMGYQVAIDALERIVSRGEVRRPAERRPEERREERDREESGDESESAKRRRRGRRGGRGRRRGPGGGELGDEERDSEESRGDEEREPVDIESKYANLKGATIRRGLDVLAEDEDGEETFAPVGQVTFAERSDEDGGDEEEKTTVIFPRAGEEETNLDAPIRRVRVTGGRRPGSETPPRPPAEGKAAEDRDEEERDAAPAKKGGRRKTGAKSGARTTARKTATRKRTTKKTMKKDEETDSSE